MRDWRERGDELKTPSPGFKAWLEVIEKALVTITLVIGIGASAYKASVFLSAKTAQSTAATGKLDVEKEEATKRIELIDAIGAMYVQQLNQIDSDLRKLDEELKSQAWKDSYGWEMRIAVRQEKAKDRQVLIENIGRQLLELKRIETATAP